MTSIGAQDQPGERLTALERRVREVWGTYRENLVELDGVAYLEAERAEWGMLQEELREIAAERAGVKAELARAAEAAPEREAA